MDIKKLVEETKIRQKTSSTKWRLAKKPIEMSINGVNIVVLPKVFPPKGDSIALAKNLKLKPTDVVLDTCAGSGIQTIYAAKVAKKVYSCDISPYAVQNIKLNVKNNKMEDKVFIYKADLFPKTGIKYNVIICNPPYVDEKPTNIVEQSIWDLGNSVLKRLLNQARKHLLPGGKIYISWANFAGLEFFENEVKRNGFKFRRIAKGSDAKDPRIIFYVYELV